MVGSNRSSGSGPGEIGAAHPRVPLTLAALVDAAATAGSLYLSLGLGLVPSELY